jgi:hypothetical protein
LLAKGPFHRHVKNNFGDVPGVLADSPLRIHQDVQRVIERVFQSDTNVDLPAKERWP